MKPLEDADTIEKEVRGELTRLRSRYVKGLTQAHGVWPGTVTPPDSLRRAKHAAEQARQMKTEIWRLTAYQAKFCVAA